MVSGSHHLRAARGVQDSPYPCSLVPTASPNLHSSAFCLVWGLGLTSAAWAGDTGVSLVGVENS